VGKRVLGAPKILEPRRRKLGVANRMLDVAVPQGGLQGAGMPLCTRGVASSLVDGI
jgi:hypothetical protein